MKKQKFEKQLDKINSRLKKANENKFRVEEMEALHAMVSIFSKEMNDFIILKKKEENFFMIGCAVFTNKGIAKCLLSKMNNDLDDYLHFIPFKSIHSIRFSLNGKIEPEKQVNEFMLTFSRGGSKEDNVYFKCESKKESLKFIKLINDFI